MWFLATALAAAPTCEQPLQPTGSVADLQPAVVALSHGGGSGSGFFVNGEGALVTAAHVVDGVDRVTVQLGTVELEGEVVRRDPSLDLALVDVAGARTPCLALGGEAPVGADVWGLGFPGGAELGASLSRGISSGRKTVRDRYLLQVDASISPGNSGGPLVDANGAVAGVVSWKMMGGGFEGMGFAVPSDVLLAWLEEEPAKRVVGVVTEPSLAYVPYPMGVRGPEGMVPLASFVALTEQPALQAELQRRRRRRHTGWAMVAGGVLAGGASAGLLVWTADDFGWNTGRDLAGMGLSAAAATSSWLLLRGGGRHVRSSGTRYQDVYTTVGLQQAVERYNRSAP